MPLDPQQRKMEICTGYFVLEEQENDEKYKAIDSYFSDSGLPYISTIHEISSWNYEGDENRGSIDLFIDSKVQVQYDICFEESLFLGQTSARMIRKYLQMTNKNFSLKYCSNKEYISGLFFRGCLLDSRWYWQKAKRTRNFEFSEYSCAIGSSAIIRYYCYIPCTSTLLQATACHIFHTLYVLSFLICY